MLFDTEKVVDTLVSCCNTTRMALKATEKEKEDMGKLDWLFILFVVALAVGSLLATLPRL